MWGAVLSKGRPTLNMGKNFQSWESLGFINLFNLLNMGKIGKDGRVIAPLEGSSLTKD